MDPLRRPPLKEPSIRDASSGDELEPTPGPRPLEASAASGSLGDEWIRERAQVQNPILRAVLGCLKVLGPMEREVYEVRDAEPRVLLEQWGALDRVAKVLREDLRPLLLTRSCRELVGASRRRGLLGLSQLEEAVFVNLDSRFSRRGAVTDEGRKSLRLAIEKIYSFLLDLFGEIMAADPRSPDDADFFMLRALPRDIDTSPRLVTAVRRLEEFLSVLEETSQRLLLGMIRRIEDEEMIPCRRAWSEIDRLLVTVQTDVQSSLQSIKSMPGVRAEESERVSEWIDEIQLRTRTIGEVYETARIAIDEIKEWTGPSRLEREQCVQSLRACHQAFSRRLTSRLYALSSSLDELCGFVPVWRRRVERRRALAVGRRLSGVT